MEHGTWNIQREKREQGHEVDRVQRHAHADRFRKGKQRAARRATTKVMIIPLFMSSSPRQISALKKQGTKTEIEVDKLN